MYVCMELSWCGTVEFTLNFRNRKWEMLKKGLKLKSELPGVHGMEQLGSHNVVCPVQRLKLKWMGIGEKACVGSTWI